MWLIAPITRYINKTTPFNLAAYCSFFTPHIIPDVWHYTHCWTIADSFIYFNLNLNQGIPPGFCNGKHSLITNMFYMSIVSYN